MHPKYNLSISRIVSRLFLTGIIGVAFIVAIIPFMAVTNGLLYEQKVSIGGDNITKAIILWGTFTLIVGLFTFWKKRFRMTSVFLIIWWFIGLFINLSILALDKNDYRCRRSAPYSMPQEFNRAFDLLSQRMGADEKAKGTVYQTFFNYRNCIDIQYLPNESDETEAYFLMDDDSNLKHLKIFVKPSYKQFDDLTLAALLVHELVHAGQYINDKTTNTTKDCYLAEAEAFVAELQFLSTLNSEEQRSIYARIKDNVKQNPIFETMLTSQELEDESYKACLTLQKENNLTQIQLNQCTWTGTQNKIEKEIRESPNYQEQCK